MDKSPSVRFEDTALPAPPGGQRTGAMNPDDASVIGSFWPNKGCPRLPARAIQVSEVSAIATLGGEGICASGRSPAGRPPQ